MRTIKFRGQIEHTNEWVQGYYFETPLTDGKTDSMPEDGWSFLTGKKRHVISRNNCVYQVNPETVGEFTGFTDKNGVEIYEGDIVMIITVSDKNRLIQFSKGCFEVVSINNRSIAYNIDEYYGNDYEVVGNRFDNPSLLLQ